MLCAAELKCRTAKTVYSGEDVVKIPVWKRSAGVSLDTQNPKSPPTPAQKHLPIGSLITP